MSAEANRGPAHDGQPGEVQARGGGSPSHARSNADASEQTGTRRHPLPQFRVRPAVAGDAPAIAEIYNEGIRDRIATFETRRRTADEVAAWIGDARHPTLVAESVGRVVGWVAASKYRDRACYAGVAELSMYVRASARGRRVGDTLMASFLTACEAAGLWKLLSRVFPENTASRALCRRHDFREVGMYERHARLDGVWRDVVIVERLLGAAREVDPKE